MSAHVLFHLFNKLGKEIKCEACRAFYFFFHNDCNKFNNTGARTFYLSYDHKTTLKLCFYCEKKQRFCHTRHYYGHQYITLQNM